MNRSTKSSTVLLLLVFLGSFVNGQQLTINTKKIDRLIGQWNSIHNGRDIEAFQNVYDDELLYYAERVPRTKVTLLKKLVFVRNPEYKQRITGDVKYIMHSNGIVKCEFKKEVWEHADWKVYPMYLLVGFKNHGYWIMGESDYPTDTKLGYNPDLGKPMDFEILSANASEYNRLTAGLSNSDKANLKTISIRADHLYLLVIMLTAGGVVLFITRGLRNKKEGYIMPGMAPHPEVEYDPEPEVMEVPLPSDVKVPAEAYQVVENQLKHDAFKKYALGYFDQFSFLCNKIQDHTPGVGDIVADFEFELNNKEVQRKKFDVFCLYREDRNGEIELVTPEQFQSLQSSPSGNPRYFVIGIGGPPHFPNELYLVPENHIQAGLMKKEELKPFRRTGNFFYNRSTGMLQ
jgi:hypothetical protein